MPERQSEEVDETEAEANPQIAEIDGSDTPMPDGKKCNRSGLEKTGWNRKAAARLLGVSYRTILYKIDQYEMTAPESYLSSLPGRMTFLSHKGTGK